MFVTKLESSGAVAYSTIVPGVSNLPYAYNVNNFLPYAVAVDATGNAFIGGRAGPGLPTSTGALSTLFPGDLNNSSQSVGFVLKLNPSASQIDFATYLPETESVAAIILRDSGASYVAGRTNSPSFPASPGAFQTTMAAGVNCTCNAGYVAELDATGSTLIAATFLAGTPAQTNAGTSILSLSRSTSGSLLVGGITASVDFPLVTPLEKNFPGYANTGFATEVKPDLSAVLFSTFISGLRGTSHTERLHLDTAPGGNIVVAGTTDDYDFPTTLGSFQPNLPATVVNGNAHGFVARIDPTVAAGSACLSAYSIGFGNTLIYTHSAQDLVITNCGDTEFRVVDVKITGSDFTESNKCAVALQPTASCTISVEFTPSDRFVRLGSLTIETDTPVGNFQIPLSGIGIAPYLSVKAEQDFGDQSIGVSGPAILIDIANLDSGNLIVSDVQTTGDFAAQNLCTVPVPKNTGCSIRVVFTPTAVGSRSGQLAIFSNAPASPHNVQLTGTGTASVPNPVPAIISASPFSAKQNSGGVTVTLDGSGFVNGAVVRWNGSSRTTSFISYTQVSATIPASDLVSAGTATITVTNPAPGGGNSDVLMFAIDTATQSTVTLTAADITLTAGQSAAVPVQLSGLTGSVSVACLNAPANVTCSYNSDTKTLNIQSSSSTPKGTYTLTVVFSANAATWLFFHEGTWAIWLWTLLLPVRILVLRGPQKAQENRLGGSTDCPVRSFSCGLWRRRWWQFVRLPNRPANSGGAVLGEPHSCCAVSHSLWLD